MSNLDYATKRPRAQDDAVPYDPPSVWARIGAGWTDGVVPLDRAFYRAQFWAPEKLQQYNAQRAADNAAYLAGFAPELPPEQRATKPDLWRALGGSFLPTSAFEAPPGASLVASDPTAARIAQPFEEVMRQIAARNAASPQSPPVPDPYVARRWQELLFNAGY